MMEVVLAESARGAMTKNDRTQSNPPNALHLPRNYGSIRIAMKQDKYTKRIADSILVDRLEGTGATPSSTSRTVRTALWKSNLEERRL